MATLTNLVVTTSFAENTVNAAPQLLDADVTFTAGDSLAGGRLVVSGLLAQDRVSVLDQGNGAGQIGFANGTVSYGGVAIGTASGGQGGDFTVAFNAQVSGAAVDALIQRLAYANASDTPTATRTLGIDIQDAQGGHQVSGPMVCNALTGSADPFAGIDVGRFSAPSFADLDGDGKLDLVVGNGYGALAAWRNTGSGYTALTGSANPFAGIDVGADSAPVFADLDGDGKLDLVVGDFYGWLHAWRNTGSGYAALTGSADPFAGIDLGNYSAPAFADLDADGTLDLVAGGYYGTLPAWRNTGSGYTALTGSANPFAGIYVGYVSAPAFADLDADGKLDLVAGNYDGTLQAWRNAATLPSITVAVTAENDAPAITSAAMASTAENRAATEIVYQASARDPDLGAGSIAWSLSGTDAALFTIGSDGAVRFRAAPDFEAPADAGANNTYDITVEASDGTATTSQAVAISVIDQVDIGTLTNLATTASFAENTVNAAPQVLDSDVTFTAGESLAGGRLVVSGLLALDRVSVLDQGSGAGQIGFANGTVSYGGVAIGTASGGQGDDFTVAFNAQVSGAAVDALIQRLAYANASDTPTATRTLSIDIQDAQGGHQVSGPMFCTALTGSANAFAGIDVGFDSAPSFADLDADGKLDLVVGNYDGMLQAWRNTGSGYTALTGSANPFAGIDVGVDSAPSFADLDADGKLDLVVGNYDGKLHAWRNTGSGYTALTGSANPFAGIDMGLASAPAFADLDDDGKLDLVVGAQNGTLHAWRNTGSGYAALTGSANPFAGIDVGVASAPAFADLDDNGKLDLVVGNYDGMLQAWRDTGSGYTAMTGSADPFAGISVSYLSAPSFADLDGDGKLDLVVGGFNGTLLAWLHTSPWPSITVAVTAENDAPAIISAATASKAENRAATEIVYQANASDPDLGAGSIAWSLSGTDAALFTIGSDGAVRFRAVPDFEAPADAGANNTYDITVEASDGTATTSKAVAISVTNQLEPATLTNLAATASVAENTVNAAPQLLDADVTFAAVDSLAGGRLVVSGLLAQDRVSVLDQGSGAGQIGFANGTVSYGGVAIGTASGGQGGDFTVAFNAQVSGAAVDALIQCLAYANASDTPTATRTLSIDIQDAQGGHQVVVGAPYSALTGSAAPFAGIDVGQVSAPSFSDLDGDGKLDLVSGEFFGTLLVWRNTGSGYAALTGSANPFDGIDVGFSSAPAFSDLDGDGRLDLVVGSYDGTLLAWRNTGSGYTALTGSANPFDGIDVGIFSAPSFSDLDADGKLDLVVGNDAGTLLAWRSTGSGYTALTGSANPFDGIDIGTASMPSFADLDGDGKLDLVVGNDIGTLLAWRNTGSGYTALTGSANPFDGIDVGYYSAPAFADLDADGKLDLVVGDFYGSLQAWRNTTTLPSIAVTVTAENDAPAIISAATVSTVENRAATDIVYQANASDPDLGAGSIAWSLSGTDAALFTIGSDGAVRLRATPDFEAPADAGANNTYDITVEASDGTATTSKAVAISVTNQIEPATLTNLAATASVAENTVNAAPQLLDADVTFTAGDSLAGGRLVVSGLLTEDRVSVLDQGNSAGQIGFANGTVSYGGVAIGTASGGQGGDFTVAFNAQVSGAAVNALIQRLAYANASDTPTATRTLSIDIQDAQGGHQVVVGAPYTALAGIADPFASINVSYLSAPSFADLDADGKLDLVVGNQYGTLAAWRNTGSGYAALTGSANPFDGLNAGGYVSAPSFADLDGDGNLDLVVGELYGKLAAWRNTGSGYTALSGSANPFAGIDVGFGSAPSFADLDADGKLDLVVGNYDGNLLAWRNTGSGYAALTGSANPFAGIDVGYYSAPAFADLDADGKLDLVVGNYDGSLQAWRNMGSGYAALTGSADPFAGIGFGYYSAPAFADLDGDGKLDLVVGELSGSLQAWRNTTTLPSITIAVTAENEAPAITSAATASTVENRAATEIVYQASASDSDLGAGSIAWSLSGTDAALFTIGSDGAVRFRPPPDFEAPADAGANNTYDITVEASDGTATTSKAVAIAVTDVNEAPSVTSADTISIVENTAGAFHTVTGIDPESHALTWSLSGADSAFFTLDSVSGALSFKTAPNYESPQDAGGNNVYDVIVTTSDSVNNSAPHALAIVVTDVNEAPSVTSADTIFIAENTAGAFHTVTGSDPESHALTWSLSGADSTFFTLDSVSGALSFKTAPNYESPQDAGGNNVYDVIVTASDSVNNSAPHALAIAVTDVNEAPSVTSADTISIAENTAGVLHTVTGSDPESHALTWSLSGADSAFFTLDSVSGALSFKTAPNYESPQDAGGNNVYDVIVTASDSVNNSAPHALAIAVTDAAANVSIAAQAAIKTEGQSDDTPFTFTVTRGGDTSGPVSTDWAITGSGPHAADATDFAGAMLPSGTVSFADGETSKTITVNVASDLTQELTEGFTVTLSHPSTDTTIGTATAQGVILNDEPAQHWAIDTTAGDDLVWQSSTGAFRYTQAVAGLGGNQLVGTPGAGHQFMAAGQFGGDAGMDLLWAATDGSALVGLGAGSPRTFNFVTVATPGTGWTLWGTGDLDHDGRTDLLWKNGGGMAVTMLDAQGGKVADHWLGGAGAGWDPVAAVDLNGDGRTDILWRNDALGGALASTLTPTDGTAFAGSNWLSQPGTDWSFAGVGDFTGDGRADTFWLRPDGFGSVMVTAADGRVNAGSYWFSAPGTGWEFLGIGDFNGDGQADTVWQSPSRGDAIATHITRDTLSANGTNANGIWWGVPAAGTHFVGVADTNGDGRDDLLFEAADGSLSAMLSASNGATASTVAIGTPGSDWHLI